MVSQHIEKISARPATLLEQPLAETAAGAPEGASLDLVDVFRRRWKIAVLVALICGATTNAVVWTKVKPKYGATAMIRVSPIIAGVVEDPRPMAHYSSFVNTQAHLLLSRQVLTRAIEDSAVSRLQRIQVAADPIASLAAALEVKLLPRTQLIQVQMASLDQSEVAPIVNAVVGAYMELVASRDMEQDSRTITSLERERETLMSKRRQAAEAIRKLAEEFGTTAVGERQNAMLEAIQEISTALARAEVDGLMAQARLEQLQEGALLATSAEELAAAAGREAFVNSDAVVGSLAQQLAAAVAERQRYLAGNLTPQHQLVRATENRIEGLREALASERDRAAGEYDRRMQGRRKELAAAVLAETKQELARSEHLKNLLAEALKQRDLKSIHMGKKGLSIQTLQEELEAVKQEYERVNQRLRQMEIERQRPARVSLASAAATPAEPNVDKRKKYSVVAMMGSLFVAFSIALLTDRFDARVRAISDVQGYSQLHVLGTVPRLKDLLDGRVSREEFAEAYRIIRTCLSSFADRSLPRSLVVTSANSGDGKTGLAVSLAASMAETGQRVLLIDGDIRKPDIGQSLRLSDCDRLSAALGAEQPLKELVISSAVSNLDVLPAVASNGQTAQLLTPQRVKRLLSEATRHYEMIIIDSPPVLLAADALVWGQAADGVICSVLAGRSNRAAVWSACDRLRQVDAKVLGTVVGNVSQSNMYYGSSYGSSSVGGINRRKGRHDQKREPPPLVVLPDEVVKDDQDESRDTHS